MKDKFLIINFILFIGAILSIIIGWFYNPETIWLWSNVLFFIISIHFLYSIVFLNEEFSKYFSIKSIILITFSLSIIQLILIWRSFITNVDVTILVYLTYFLFLVGQIIFVIFKSQKNKSLTK
jgi:hypothetical protein